MAKRKLIGAYIYQGETYGPGEEVEVPDDNAQLNKTIDAGEKVQAQQMSERLASVGIDPVAMGLPEPQLSNTAPPSAQPVTMNTAEAPDTSGLDTSGSVGADSDDANAGDTGATAKGGRSAAATTDK